MHARIWQIRRNDSTIVFRFYDDAGSERGSRGIMLSDTELNELFDISYGEIISDIVISDTPSTTLESLAKRAYDEFVEAKKAEEDSKAEVIEIT